MRRAPAVLVLCLGAGCVSEPLTRPREPLPRDACNAMLERWAEGMLRHYAARRRLPETPEELAACGRGPPPADRHCPTSKQPYVFEPQGLRSPGLDGRLVLLDPPGAHAGFRWAVLVTAPAGNQPLSIQVVPLVEK